jgi:O-antigen ligase
MHNQGRKKIDPFFLVAMVLFAAVAIGIGVALPNSLPVAIMLMTASVLLFYWALRWDVTLWAWLWVLSYGLLNWPEWKLEITGFFNMTVPRFIFIGAIIGYGLFFLLHRRRIRFDRAILWAMLALIIYVGVNVHITGWTAETQEISTAPYFRFLGSILLPFTMFFLLYNVGSSEKQIPRALILLTIYGWYALYIGYMQWVALHYSTAARALIWPAYINDPTYGYMFDRARGAFSIASPQAVFLTVLFFVDLFLIRKIRGWYRVALIIQALLVPAAIFFTGMRSAFVAFIACSFVWALLANRRRFAWAKAGIILVVLVIGVYAMWNRLASTDRATGGVATPGPILSREILLHRTWQIFKESPFGGVGFGHFVDKVYSMERDPTALSSMDTGVLVEHNLFLNMLAETGIFGLILTVLVFWLLFTQSLKLYRKLPPGATGYLSREFVVLFWVVMVNYLTDATFRDPLWDVFSSALFWCFGAYIVFYNRLLEPQPLELPIAEPAWAK